MGRVMLACVLTVTPTPHIATKEMPAWAISPPTVLFAAPVPMTSPSYSETYSDTDRTQDSPVEIAKPAPLEPSPSPPTPIEAALNHLSELGASPWQLRTFGCLAWFESRNDPYAVSRTGDYGILQINRRFHAWRWAGRDIFDPIVNAEVAWDIYRESGFRAWTTHGLCGV